MRWPQKFKGGQHYPHVVSTLDIVPTCLAASSTNVEADLDGHNLLTALANPDTGTVHTEPIFWEWNEQYAVRDGDWKLLKGRLYEADTKNLEPGKARGTALYNITNDIGEQTDQSEAEPEIFQRLNKLYENWREEMLNDPAQVHTPYVNYQMKK